MLSKLKTYGLIVLGVIAGILVIINRAMHKQSVGLKVKVAQGRDKVAAEKEKAAVDKIITEAQNAAAYRKSLVAQFRRNKPKR